MDDNSKINQDFVKKKLQPKHQLEPRTYLLKIWEDRDISTTQKKLFKEKKNVIFTALNLK